jgi:hypothetical protein
MTKGKFRAGLGVAIFMAATAAHAQYSTMYVRPQYRFPDTPPVGGPAALQVGDSPVYVTPYIGAAGGHDDNLFLSNINRKASNIWTVSPGAKLDARDENKVFQLAYDAQIGRYTSSSDDNYVDQTARAQFDMALDPHNFIHLGYDYIRGHDPRGSTDRPILGEPDRYRSSNPQITYALGAPGASGHFEVYYQDPDIKYLNNRTTTASSDRTEQQLGTAFYWRVAPRTYVMAEARATDIRYDSATISNADERRYYGGLTWEATAATTGTIKVGQLKRDFKNGTTPDFSGTTWEGLVTWAPRSYSKFDFYTARQTNESTGLGNFILTSIGGVTWTHGWTTYITTAVDARYQKDDYQGFDRKDKTTILALKGGYKFRRWLTFGAEYTHTSRDSNLDQYDYDKNLYLLTLTASM